MNTGIYSAGFVVNVIINGKMQDISKNNTISVKFNSEYQIRIQNKNSRRAVAKVFVDDENVSQGGVVIPAYSHVDLQGPVGKNFNFKFVSLDSGQAADAGKSTNRDGEKGTIRVEFQLEREAPKPVINFPHNPWYTERSPREKGLTGFNDESVKYPTSYSVGATKGESYSNKTCSSYGSAETKTCGGILTSDEGILGLNSIEKETAAGCTVSGERNNQNFYKIDIDLENKPPVILQLTLKGWDEKTLPLLDGSCVYCSSCGKKATKPTDKFCSRCGSKLS